MVLHAAREGGAFVRVGREGHHVDVLVTSSTPVRVNTPWWPTSPTLTSCPSGGQGLVVPMSTRAGGWKPRDPQPR